MNSCIKRELQPALIKRRLAILQHGSIEGDRPHFQEPRKAAIPGQILNRLLQFLCPLAAKQSMAEIRRIHRV